MNKSKKIILLGVSVVIFVLLFYKETIGLNFGILAVITWLMIHLETHKRKKTKFYWVLSIAVFVAAFNQMWYADIPSFITLFLTTSTFGIFAMHTRLAFVLYPVVMTLNYATAFFRIFTFRWLPQTRKGTKVGQKVIAFGVVPLIFITLFLGIYTTGSNVFYNFFKNFRLNLDLARIGLVTLVGLFFFFNLWMLFIPRMLIRINKNLDFDFKESARLNLKSTYGLFDLDIERKGGEITLILLNVLLLIFVLSYNYEQFFQAQNVSRLSADTHTRIYTIVFSVLMAIALLLFYFKSTFNFDPKAGKLKKWAYVWLALNSVLVVSAFLKNGEYILYYGLTVKRLGVIVFLILCFIGMYFTYKKICNQKTNYYLITKMAWTFFFALLFSTTLNFSWVVTKYNITFQKYPDYYYLVNLDHNYHILSRHNAKTGKMQGFEEFYESEKQWNSKRNFLSKNLYYSLVVK